jgi:excisionase family DNA binding protein
MRKSDELPEILSTAQAAKVLGVSHRTVLHWIAAGRIAALKTGPGTAGYVIARAEIERLQADAAVARTG